MSVQKPREIAARILAQREIRPVFIEEILDRELAQHALPARDRALCQELTFGVVRWESALNWLISRKTGGRTQKSFLQVILQLGLYQLFWLDRIPAHAAVHEMVELARQGGFGPQAGFVNALLRGYVRERADTRRLLAQLQDTEPSVAFNHPEWLCRRWEERWGREKMFDLLRWDNAPPSTIARVNTLKTEAGRLTTAWQREGVEFEPVSWPWTGNHLVYLLKHHPPLETLPSFKDGFFYLQDPSTLLAVRELDPQPGETVLDVCAAPGGKATFIAQVMENRGEIQAEDIDSNRLRRLEENCLRLGTSAVRIASTGAPGMEKGKPFDRVLLDAPCSNSGVLRRRLDLRRRLSTAELDRLGKVQLDLLVQSGARVRNGGRLVYSTCSLEPEENSRRVTAFLESRADFRLEKERELLPFRDEVDGAYLAVLKRE